MKKIAYIDCFAGVSGDMLLGAILDVGLTLGELQRALRGVPLKGYRIEAKRVKRAGLAGTKATVEPGARAGMGIHGLRDILAVIGRSALPESVRHSGEEVFRELARAEASVHGKQLARTHFHEVGAVDSLIDVLGSLAGLHLLGVREVYASALPWNAGTVTCAHGALPIPAPATAELMRGMPVYPHPLRAELVTPTGAAILKVVAAKIGFVPPMKVARIGYGAGSAEFQGFPNLLRLVLGEASGRHEADSVAVLETEMDDMSPALFRHLCERLFAGGALDAFVTPVLMKKGRPGHLLTVLCRPDDAAPLAGIIFRESTTLGLRCREERRVILPREESRVTTPYGSVRVKRVRRPDGRITVSPEYDDCARLASRRGVPLMQVMAAASLAAQGEVGRGQGGRRGRGAVARPSRASRRRVR
jgi:uncharacterized protein (TIGR00299 family) protein